MFDWDGTLVDSTAIIAGAIQAACRDVGEPVPDDVSARFVIGLGLADALSHVAPSLPRERHPELSARYRHHYLARDAEIPLFEGVPALLADRRAAGYMLAVATGKTRVGLDRALGACSLDGRFHATRCADEGYGKPHPGMLQALMEELRVGSDRTLMIGDTSHDMEMARAAGVAGLGVTYGAHSTDALVACGPLACVPSVEELRNWLAQHV